MDIKDIKIPKINIAGFFNKNIDRLLLGFILILVILLICILYQSLYITTISPKEIPANEITARQEKVNLKLLDEVNKNIEEKEELPASQMTDLNNIFKPY